jgi:hypothetical protein
MLRLDEPAHIQQSKAELEKAFVSAVTHKTPLEDLKTHSH